MFCVARTPFLFPFSSPVSQCWSEPQLAVFGSPLFSVYLLGDLLWFSMPFMLVIVYCPLASIWFLSVPFWISATWRVTTVFLRLLYSSAYECKLGPADNKYSEEKKKTARVLKPFLYGSPICHAWVFAEAGLHISHLSATFMGSRHGMVVVVTGSCLLDYSYNEGTSE